MLLSNCHWNNQESYYANESIQRIKLDHRMFWYRFIRTRFMLIHFQSSACGILWIPYRIVDAVLLMIPYCWIKHNNGTKTLISTKQAVRVSQKLNKNWVVYIKNEEQLSLCIWISSYACSHYSVVHTNLPTTHCRFNADNLNRWIGIYVFVHNFSKIKKFEWATERNKIRTEEAVFSGFNWNR